MKFGTKVTDQQIQNSRELMEMFAPVEGLNCCYYGKVRNGKTRTATADILELLKRGEPVFCNWHIDFPDFDERSHKSILFAKFLARRKYFFKYSADNLHYINPDELITGEGEVNVQYLNRLVGAHLFIDEGQWLFSSLDRSHDEESIAKMKLVLHGGHYCRSLNIITQRPGNISKNMRSQINIWYRCVKRFDMFGLMIFQRWAIEDMKDDLPVDFETDSDGRQIPLGDCKSYFVNKKHDVVFNSYNTHAMRGKDAIDVPVYTEVFETTGWQRFLLLIGAILPFTALKAVKGQIAPSMKKVMPEERIQLAVRSEDEEVNLTAK